MTRLFTMQKYICGVNAIITSAGRGTYPCQGQKRWEDVHTTARGRKQEKGGLFWIKFCNFFPTFWTVKTAVFMISLEVASIPLLSRYFSNGHAVFTVVIEIFQSGLSGALTNQWIDTNIPEEMVQSISDWIFLLNELVLHLSKDSRFKKMY